MIQHHQECGLYKLNAGKKEKKKKLSRSESNITRSEAAAALRNPSCYLSSNSTKKIKIKGVRRKMRITYVMTAVLKQRKHTKWRAERGGKVENFCFKKKIYLLIIRKSAWHVVHFPNNIPIGNYM